MNLRSGGASSGVLLALALGLAALTGCRYVRYRVDDATEMFDIGFTFSRKPQLAAYMNCPVIVPIGYGKVDGRFVGMGGGKIGVMEHHQESAGLLVWGREEVSWEGFDEQDAQALSVQGVGLLGLTQAQERDEPYTPACIHYLHIGWVGIAANVRWLEIPDFLLGIVFLDPAGDDGKDVGRWFWQSGTAEEAPAPQNAGERTGQAGEGPSGG